MGAPEHCGKVGTALRSSIRSATSCSAADTSRRTRFAPDWCADPGSTRGPASGATRRVGRTSSSAGIPRTWRSDAGSRLGTKPIARSSRLRSIPPCSTRFAARPTRGCRSASTTGGWTWSARWAGRCREGSTAGTVAGRDIPRDRARTTHRLRVRLRTGHRAVTRHAARQLRRPVPVRSPAGAGLAGDLPSGSLKNATCHERFSRSLTPLNQKKLEASPNRHVLLQPRDLVLVHVLPDLATELLDVLVRAVFLELVAHAWADAGDEEDLLPLRRIE